MLDLIPAEKAALTVALEQVRRGETPSPNVATVCVFALARLDGRYNWLAADESAASSANGDERCNF